MMTEGHWHLSAPGASECDPWHLLECKALEGGRGRGKKREERERGREGMGKVTWRSTCTGGRKGHYTEIDWSETLNININSTQKNEYITVQPYHVQH